MDERRAAMLAEMGVRSWVRPAPVEARCLEAAAVPTRVSQPPASRARAAVPAHTVPVPVPVRMAPSASARQRADAGAIATMGWPELRSEVAHCTACRLCEGRSNTVFGVGHEEAHWMVVGEAPGEQEDASGEPFVGKSGQLLDNMLAAVGLSRTQGPPQQRVFIANALKCRPPKDRNPRPEEVEQCRPFLRRQVALVAPRIILAMGRFAVSALLASDAPIGRLRGRVHDFHGVPTVVTHHPVYLLCSPADKARAWDDLCLAREIVRAAERAP